MLTEAEWREVQKAKPHIIVKHPKRCDLCDVLTGKSKQFKDGKWETITHVYKRLHKWPYGKFIRTVVDITAGDELIPREHLFDPKKVCIDCLKKYAYLEKGIL